jgi:tetratricopeptide (TPR) repeat protein
MLTMAKLINNTSDLVGDPTEKNDYILKSLKLYDTVIEQSNNSDMIGVSCNDSSALLLSLLQVEEAEKRQIKAVEMARAANDKVSEARRRANYAVFLKMRGRLAEAQAEYEESLNVLMGLNRYWDERRKNFDISPLSRGEETSLHYDKGWCAAVAEEYGVFLYFNDHEKALGLLDLARDLYTEVADQEKLERLEKTVESLQKRMAALPGGAVISQPRIPSPFESYSPRSYVTCASCGNSYSTEKTRCPSCGERTCPKCGTLAEDENETCAMCDHWLGK